MRIPGVAWTALIVTLTGVLGGWLTDYVQAPWVPIVIILLGAVAKIAETYLAAPTPPPALRQLTATTQPARLTWRQFLLG